MKRTPLRPGKPPRRKGTIQQRRPGPARRGREPLEAYRAWIRTLQCLVGRDCRGPTEACHVRSRGAGGRDRKNLVPLCAAHHREQHGLHMSMPVFQARYGLDLAAEARGLWTEWLAVQAFGGDIPW